MIVSLTHREKKTRSRIELINDCTSTRIIDTNVYSVDALHSVKRERKILLSIDEIFHCIVVLHEASETRHSVLFCIVYKRSTLNQGSVCWPMTYTIYYSTNNKQHKEK